MEDKENMWLKLHCYLKKILEVIIHIHQPTIYTNRYRVIAKEGFSHLRIHLRIFGKIEKLFRRRVEVKFKSTPLLAVRPAAIKSPIVNLTDYREQR